MRILRHRGTKHDRFQSSVSCQSTSWQLQASCCVVRTGCDCGSEVPAHVVNAGMLPSSQPPAGDLLQLVEIVSLQDNRGENRVAKSHWAFSGNLKHDIIG